MTNPTSPYPLLQDPAELIHGFHYWVCTDDPLGAVDADEDPRWFVALWEDGYFSCMSGDIFDFTDAAEVRGPIAEPQTKPVPDKDQSP